MEFFRWMACPPRITHGFSAREALVFPYGSFPLCLSCCLEVSGCRKFLSEDFLVVYFVSAVVGFHPVNPVKNVEQSEAVLSKWNISNYSLLRGSYIAGEALAQS